MRSTTVFGTDSNRRTVLHRAWTVGPYFRFKQSDLTEKKTVLVYKLFTVFLGPGGAEIELR